MAVNDLSNHLKKALEHVENNPNPQKVHDAFVVAIEGLDTDQRNKNALYTVFDRKFQKAMNDGKLSKGDIKHLKSEIMKDADVIKDLLPLPKLKSAAETPVTRPPIVPSVKPAAASSSLPTHLEFKDPETYP